jgi:hypothetical protein
LGQKYKLKVILGVFGYFLTIGGIKMTAVAAVLRALVDKLSYEYHYHMDDGEGGIQYNCKNTIIDVNELNELAEELEAFK